MLLARLDLLVLQVSLEHQAFRERQDPLALQDLSVQPARREVQVLSVRLAQQALQVPRVFKEHPALLVLLEHLAGLVLRDLLA